MQDDGVADRPMAYSIFRKGDVMSGSRGWSGRVFAARSLPSTSVCFLHDSYSAITTKSKMATPRMKKSF